MIVTGVDCFIKERYLSACAQEIKRIDVIYSNISLRRVSEEKNVVDKGKMD